jgi:hypothetical protein
MTYKELQAFLKSAKLQGSTDIKLNASKELLEIEYDRLKNVVASNTEEKKCNLAFDRFIEIIEKTLFINLYSDRKVSRSMIAENIEITFNELIYKIAKDADVNRIDLLLAMEQNLQDDFGFNLTDYRYNSINYFLEIFTVYIVTTEKKLKTTAVEAKEIEIDYYPLDNVIPDYVKVFNLTANSFCGNISISEDDIYQALGHNLTLREFLKSILLDTGVDYINFRMSLKQRIVDGFDFYSEISIDNYQQYSLFVFFIRFKRVCQL